MSSKGGYAGMPPRHSGDGRFYNSAAAAMRRQQQQEFQEYQQQQAVFQHQQMMQQAFFHQQQLEYHEQQQQQQQREFQMQRRTRRRPENNGESSRRGGEQQGDGARRGGGAVVALAAPLPPSFGGRYNSKMTNLDRLMKSLTPYIPVQYSQSESSSGRGRKTREPNRYPFFCLDALWDSLYEWSVYGVGVPLLLNGKDPVEQYYVPSLSGIQLYIDPSKAPSELKMSTNEVDAESSDSDNKLKSSLNRQWVDKSLCDKSFMTPSSSEADVPNLPAQPTFQFLESEQPHVRRPLSDKAFALTSQHPELSNCRSCDLLPTSWICVAWYPIYRIPTGLTLKDVDSCFLTFHSLSTQSKSWPQNQLHAPNARKNNGSVDPPAKISLPVFGLASYKLKDAIVNPNVPHEYEQEKSLLKAADEWLNKLQVKLPDYQFFRSQPPPYRR